MPIVVNLFLASFAFGTHLAQQQRVFVEGIIISDARGASRGTGKERLSYEYDAGHL